jgi:hypothetical protein
MFDSFLDLFLQPCSISSLGIVIEVLVWIVHFIHGRANEKLVCLSSIIISFPLYLQLIISKLFYTRIIAGALVLFSWWRHQYPDKFELLSILASLLLFVLKTLVP